MKLLLSSVMMSVCSIVLMTVLTLGITQLQAAEVRSATSTTSTSPVATSAQQELTDLFFAAAKTGNTDVIHEFLKHGFPVNLQNSQGFTPLMMAAYYGQKEVVSILLSQGADRCIRDHKGNTALMGAMFKLEWSIVKQLRQVDCDANAQQSGQKTVAEFAKVIGQDKKLQQILAEK